MFKVSKRMEISAMHHLDLDYDSPCTNFHGHNWIITVEIEGETLCENGMLIDFKHIKQLIHDRLDHKNLNDIFTFNPTAENMAWWIKTVVNNHLGGIDGRHCSKVTVQESEGNVATWERG